jgi:hypothetical protein
MSRLEDQDKDYSFKTSHQRTRQINYADILDTMLRRAFLASNQGEVRTFCQTIDDISDFLTPHKDVHFFRAIKKINTDKEQKEKKTRLQRISKDRITSELSALQYASKRKVLLAIMELLSRTGFFPARFIQMDIDTDPEEEFKDSMEEIKGKPTLEAMLWKDLRKLAKDSGIKTHRLTRKQIIKKITRRMKE